MTQCAHGNFTVIPCPKCAKDEQPPVVNFEEKLKTLRKETPVTEYLVIFYQGPRAFPKIVTAYSETSMMLHLQFVLHTMGFTRVTVLDKEGTKLLHEYVPDGFAKTVAESLGPGANVSGILQGQIRGANMKRRDIPFPK